MVDWYNKCVNYIDELLIEIEKGVSGIVFDIDGLVVSLFQFFLMDSVEYYVRGFLYFNIQVCVDFLKFVIDFVWMDIFYMIEIFEWE